MKYTIISISDDRKENINKIKETMHQHEFVDDIAFFDGRKKEEPFKVLQSYGVRTDVYSPDDGRTDPMTNSECGCWISHYRCIDYAKKNGPLLVFEDDAVLSNDFTARLEEAIKDLPDDWDFLSLFSESEQNILSKSSEINSKHIHKCISQLSMNVAILYSQKGAGKIIKIFNRFGTTYNVDSVIYRASRDGSLNGFIVRPDVQKYVKHGDFLSIIDPHNLRNV
jgi:GR25 family glycosyltransferase involved in LPS biosynthesis